jgi:hypothetical protein
MSCPAAIAFSREDVSQQTLIVRIMQATLEPFNTGAGHSDRTSIVELRGE